MCVYTYVHVYLDMLSGFVYINSPNGCDICRVEQSRRALRGHKVSGVFSIFSEQDEPTDTLVSYHIRLQLRHGDHEQPADEPA